MPSVASTSQVGQENRTLKVTLLSKEWRSSTEGDLSTINRELAIQLAKHSNVEVSVFLPQCSEEDRNNAASHHVQLVEAEKGIGWDPVDWLINVPYGHVMDCVVGHGISLGKQVQVIRNNHQCKWIQVVHTLSTEIAMFKKNFSQRKQLLSAEVKLCEMADQVVAIGPLVAASYMYYLRSSTKKQNVFVLTPSIFSEYLNVEQATEERETFCVLVIGSGDSCEDSILTGFCLAAQAVAELKDESYKLYFYGAPRGKEGEIAGKLLQEGISPKQIFIPCFGGRGKVLADLFCKMDLAVMPSKTEGFGVIALKALSAGLPILVSDNSGLGVALKEVPLGSQCVVKYEAPEDWARNIKMVRCKPREVRLAESKILREKYQEKYSWKEPIGRLVEKMYSLLFGKLASALVLG